MEDDDNKNASNESEEASPKASSSDSGEGGAENTSGLKGVRSLRRLRDRVERAAHELRVLREENTSLQKRITELETTVAEKQPDPQGYLFESTDPDAVKRKVEGFISAIDRYLDDDET